MIEHTLLVTRNSAETKACASRIAKEVSGMRANKARVIALSGNLGAGKTTFVQGFARALGIKEPIQSPTYILMKVYALRKKYLKHFVHIDAYRIEHQKEFEHLGLGDLIADKDAVILIEWPERVKKILPNDTLWISFEHGKKSNERMIQIKYKKAKIKMTDKKVEI